MTGLGHMTYGEGGRVPRDSRLPVCPVVRTHLTGRKFDGVAKTGGSHPDHGVSSPSGLPSAGGAEDDVGRPVEIHGAASRRLRGLRDRLVSGDAQEVHDLAESGEGNNAAVCSSLAAV